MPLKSFPYTGIAVLFITFCLLWSSGWAQTAPASSTDVFAQIDTRVTEETIDALTRGNADLRLRTIRQIKDRPESFSPPVFFVLSNVLFESGEKDEAAFWFYAAQLRARFDANRCADVSARQAATVLSLHFGRNINEHMFQNIPKLEALIPQVVAWDRRTPHRYDHRWINLHGINAISNAEGAKSRAPVTFSAPETEWEAIAEKTRSDYLNGFSEAMARMKGQQR